MNVAEVHNFLKQHNRLRGGHGLGITHLNEFTPFFSSSKDARVLASAVDSRLNNLSFTSSFHCEPFISSGNIF